MSGATTTVETTQTAASTSQHVPKSTIDNKSNEPPSSNKKPNKRHNKGKKKAPNALNATEAGTPSKLNEGENPKKPSSNNKGNSKKPKPVNNKPVAARISKDRAQGRLTQEEDHEAVPSTSSNHRKKKRSNNRQKKEKHELPPGNHDMSTILSHELKTSAYEYTSSNKMITAWRCPGCQNSQTVIPKDYLCFCGKQRNPESSRYNTPHSCDQLCKRHKSCPHECVLPCHPGPCPPCNSMGPVLTCYCGQTTRQQRCLDTDYSTKGFSCTDTCDELLGCGKHRCQQECHAGICPPCDIQEVQSCYCGRHERTARCGSGKQIQMRGHIGHYSCAEKCDAMFACGQHQCEKSCHPCTANAQPCPADPTFIKTCPCGAHTIAELVGERTSCTDPIPTCESTCNKVSACGHPCSEKCHVGDCPPCQVKVQVACRCQSTSFEETCADVCEANGGEPPLCDRICRSIRNCGRHQCGQKCCPAMKVKGKRKAGTEYAHDCPQVCDQLLSCGIHRCQDKCHKGKCLPCLEATFDDVTCHCGRTRLEPPVRCGTKLPPCPHPCIRPNPCGHIRFLNHNCHPDDEPCPPCPTLVSRPCLCGKTELKNVPCYRESPRCGRVCEKQLSCGKHICLKTCHDGPCIGENESCTQVCGGTRNKCGHVCKEKCHQGECPQTEPCTARIKATCSCGQNSIEIPCNATEESNGSKRELECNDFCAKVMRNRRLAMALDIKRDDFSTPLSPALSASSDRVFSSDDLGYYDDSLCEFYIENTNWCRQMEIIMIEFVQDANKKSFHFKPMRSEQRRFLH
ncbi:FKBP12-associated protein, partial [Rhizopus stolonifer]